jgi:adenylate cyclase
MLGADIVVSEETLRAAPGFAVLEAGELLMKGKSRPVKLFALIGDEDVAATAEFQDLARVHGRLMQTIADRQFAAAADTLALCRTASGASLTKFYDRLEKHIAEIASGAGVPIAAE